MRSAIEARAPGQTGAVRSIDESAQPPSESDEADVRAACAADVARLSEIEARDLPHDVTREQRAKVGKGRRLESGPKVWPKRELRSRNTFKVSP